jgi:hypothetical protein
MSYLLNGATLTTVSSANRLDGNNPCPGGGASCSAIYWYGSGETTYTTGLVAQAIGEYAAGKQNVVATSSGPLAGLTWGQIAQGVTNTFVAGQSSDPNSNRFGGWRYFPGTQDSDSSTTQWAVSALIYDQSLGASTPQYVKDDLAKWYAQVQQPSGVVCYQPGTQPCDNSDTGGLLLGLKFLGTSNSDSRVQAALSFLNSAWPTTANNTWYGNFGNPYAMWAQYKGLESTIGLDDVNTITNLLTDCGVSSGNGPSSACNWYQDYLQWLVTNQNADGSWTGYAYWTGVLATAFDLSILSATSIPIPPTSISEPASATILAFGVISLIGLRRRKSRRAACGPAAAPKGLLADPARMIIG